MSRYAIGIDLGTTNCALAWIDLHSPPGDHRARSMSIPQLVDIGEVGSRRLLPSFAYASVEAEFPAGSLELPWGSSDRVVVGDAARKFGSRVPGRLISSAKSWLCHPGVDRRAKILPWQSEEVSQRMSPVEASSLYLSHLRQAWDAEHADDPLSEQKVVLTIPASFDEVARELTVEAARQAGLLKVILLEEPQAAFYQWIEEDAGDPLPVGTTALVIDCGGGTTDFSLLAVVEEKGRSAYRRIAVGDHLLLGGDNLDLALARSIEAEISPQRRLDLGQWWSLVLDARRLKETMLGEDAPASMPVTVLGRGGKVIGSSMKCDVARDRVLGIVLDGFFPIVNRDSFPTSEGRSGLQEFGLPYVRDPAITRHLALFLKQHEEAMAEASPSGDRWPSAILFNGGLFHAGRCRRRILETMTSWYGADWSPRVLVTSSLDLAVAEGAAQFAYRRAKGFERIQSGAARSYYVGLGSSHDGAMLCIVPQGLAEGESLSIDQPPLELQIGEPVAFPLFSSTVRPKDVGGSIIEASPGQLAELPALTTLLRGGKRAGRTRIGVRLEAKLTEIGTLELFCVSRDGNNRWKLPFQTRVSARLASEPTGSAAHDSLVRETWSEEQLADARRAIETTYRQASGSASPASLIKEMERSLGLKKDDWPVGVLRGLWDTLLECGGERSMSAEHEARWYNLAGYVLRPGWGDPLDPFRVELLWKTIHVGVLQTKSDAVWSEYWTMCRRVAGGLDAVRQVELSKRLLSYLPVGTGKKAPRKVGSHEQAEIWRAIASLEHLPAGTKIELGRALLDESRAGLSPIYLFWSLARLGSRLPIYAPANTTIPAAEAERWVDALLAIGLHDHAMKMERAFAVVQVARQTGDRGRDVEPALIARAEEVLVNDGVPTSMLASLRQVVETDRMEQTRILGDRLPRGLWVAGQ
jgi:hypothetical protein